MVGQVGLEAAVAVAYDALGSFGAPQDPVAPARRALLGARVVPARAAVVLVRRRKGDRRLGEGAQAERRGGEAQAAELVVRDEDLVGVLGRVGRREGAKDLVARQLDTEIEVACTRGSRIERSEEEGRRRMRSARPQRKVGIERAKRENERTDEEGQLGVRHLRAVSSSDVRLVRALARTRKDRVGVEDLDKVPLALGRVRLARREVRVDEAERAVIEDKADEDRALVAVRLVEAGLDVLSCEVSDARLDGSAGEDDGEELHARVGTSASREDLDRLRDEGKGTHPDQLLVAHELEPGPEIPLDGLLEHAQPVPVAARDVVRLGRKEDGTCRARTSASDSQAVKVRVSEDARAARVRSVRSMSWKGGESALCARASSEIACDAPLES